VSTDFASWIGREYRRRDVAVEAPIRRLDALLDRSAGDADVVPALGHWLYFLPETSQSMLGEDGHSRLGDDLPDFGLPRRMWAGSRISFLADIPIGAAIERHTTIASITPKQGASGALVFVTLRHEVLVDETLVVREEQDLVYRSAADAMPTPPPLPPPSSMPRAGIGSIHVDSVALFRFSALTYNAHRIHYDRDYARDREGYGGLVVHGPFQAMLLLAGFSERFPEQKIASFSFRAHSVLLEGEEADLDIDMDAERAQLRIKAVDGRITMTAEIR
jgi:3-methylfumaryl-CoA hydratase